MEMEAETRKRDRPREAVVPRRKKEITPAEQQWMALAAAEALAAREKAMAEEKDKPPTDFLAVQAAEFRESWTRLWSDHFGDFEDTTKIPPMRFTDNPAPPYTAFRDETLQIFSVKVAGVRQGLQWPLHVFGTVALRDAVDRNRNIIFNRKRDNCQTLTQEDPNLALTGPTRAVVMLRPVTFEVELTVRGNTESEDKDLSYLAVPLMHRSPFDSCLFISDYTSKLSTLEFTHAHLFYSVEATISVRVIGGSWHGYRCQFFACTASINQEVLLLDSGNEEVPVAGDGDIELSRKVASVEFEGKLKVFVKAWHGDNFFVKKEMVFTPKEAGRSHGILNVGFCKMKVTVAWSLISRDHNPTKSLV
ncbi:uncharacterized protein LOC133901999 [Phragmites australis]|uniref:uncharacterized protein LOC133901999 n=1 Tax=Phragmites australis TaxID=29695 RepID=UPI002D774B05|nr:uncharacterized protein LOC133901999 [Phragmites australis]